MLAILIPAQELFCEQPKKSEDDCDVVFQTAFFTPILLELLRKTFADSSAQSQEDNIGAFQAELFILTEYDPSCPYRDAFYTLRQMYGGALHQRCDDNFRRLLKHSFRQLFNHPLQFTLSNDLQLGTGTIAPLEQYWSDTKFSRRLLFTRWNTALTPEYCEPYGIELNRLYSSFITKFDLHQSVESLNSQLQTAESELESTRQAFCLVDIDETILNHHDSVLFLQTVLNSPVIEVIKLFQAYLLAKQFELRCLALTARNEQLEKATWSLQPRPITAIPDVMAATAEQGLSLEFDEELSFSNPIPPSEMTKQLKLEHVLNLVRTNKLSIRAGALILLVDDCKMETSSARAQFAAARLAERDCTVLTLPVQRMGYPDQVTKLSSIFTDRPRVSIPIRLSPVDFLHPSKGSL